MKVLDKVSHRLIRNGAGIMFVGVLVWPLFPVGIGVALTGVVVGSASRAIDKWVR